MEKEKNFNANRIKTFIFPFVVEIKSFEVRSIRSCKFYPTNMKSNPKVGMKDIKVLLIH